MKHIYKYITIGLLSLYLVGCDSFFDVENYQEIPTPEAFKTVEDIENGVVGAYSRLGTYRFLGRNVIALNDMATDISLASSSAGHLVTINRYTFKDSEEDLENIWAYGYKVIDQANRIIEGGEIILTDTNITASHKARIDKAMSQAYSLKALSYLTLVNIFGLPYQKGSTNIQLGIGVLEKPLAPFVQYDRLTVGAVYTAILKDIEKAKEYMAKLPDKTKLAINQFYMNEAAIYALESRAKMNTQDYEGAKIAAAKAIELRESGNVSNEFYVKMWRSLTITDEDIFTISKTQDDHLSANSLNDLYNPDAYKAKLQLTFADIFADTDIRLGLIEDGNQPLKFAGLPTSASVSNIPIFRKSEMYLNIAECEAQPGGDISKAKTALLYTAKRNTAIATEADLPSTGADLLVFIAKERQREFFQEGHRYSDARRTGEIINTTTGNNFDIKKFVYPIPLAEINAFGGVSIQNTGWADYLPTK